jgi:hypothetical protein
MGSCLNRAGESTLYKTQEIIQEIDGDCRVTILFRDKNLGCKRAVNSGIDGFFSQEDIE